jgi:hypothetical protein
MYTLTVEEIRAIEQADEELARRHIIDYTKRMNPNYVPAPHHRLTADCLELAAILPRQMYNEPPRHGKSELISVHFPSWYLGHHPNHQFMGVSYAQHKANEFSEKARDHLRSDRYPFPGVTLAARRTEVERWKTNKGGQYLSAGIESGITGYGANVLNIDDPHPDGQSDVENEKVWDWYGGQAYTRMAPRNLIIITQTRWRDNDLSGRLLAIADTGGEQWLVVKMKALSDTNEVYAEMKVPDKVGKHVGFTNNSVVSAQEFIGRLRAAIK